jgi:hypothetical protein
MKRISLFSLALLALVFLLPGGAAQAQATRTWISGVGSDANPCSRTAPCKTWAGAIASTAAGGEIDALDPGGFGGVTITKSITLDGGGGQVASVLVSGTNGINVTAASNDIVIIRNLRLDGLLGNGASPGSAGINGIIFSSGAALILENVDIFGFNNWGINFAPSSVANLEVVNTVLANNGGGGILIAPAANANISLSGVQVLNSGAGIRVNGSAAATTAVALDRSIIAGSAHAGIRARGTGGAITFMINASNINGNLVGVQADGTGSTVYIGSSTVTGNGTGVSPLSPGQILSNKNNQINGNGADGTPLPAAPGPLN